MGAAGLLYWWYVRVCAGMCVCVASVCALAGFAVNAAGLFWRIFHWPGLKWPFAFGATDPPPHKTPWLLFIATVWFQLY